MTYCFDIGVSLFLVILQTTILPYVLASGKFYDLLIPFIIYTAVSRPSRASFPLVVFLAFLMDNMSGGPFGLYLTTYLWLFIGIRLLINVLQLGNHLIIALVTMLGVLLENLVFVGTLLLFGEDFDLPMTAAGRTAYQLAWAAVTGPFFLSAFQKTYAALEHAFGRGPHRPEEQDA
jgi:rod shape-determining protein MreD